MTDGTTEFRGVGRADVGDAIVAGDAPFYRAISVPGNLNPGVVGQCCGDMNFFDQGFLNGFRC